MPHPRLIRQIVVQGRVRRNLVADVAPELRTPIAILQGGHEAMLDGLTRPTQENLASLHEEVLRLSRMVDDLQRLAAAEAAALQLALAPHDLADIAASAADSLAESYETAQVGLERDLSSAIARCDPLRMHEIATNLLINALKFTPQGRVRGDNPVHRDSTAGARALHGSRLYWPVGPRLGVVTTAAGECLHGE